MLNRFYTYAWLNTNGKPYYIGKGCEKRAWRKSSPAPERVLILKKNLTEKQALKHEMYMIAVHKKYLDNILPGGGAEKEVIYRRIDSDKYASTCLCALLGNKTAACILLLLEEDGEIHGSKAAKVFKFGLNMVQRQLQKFETNYILTSRKIGGIRLYEFNNRNPTVRNLRTFLRTELSLQQDN